MITKILSMSDVITNSSSEVFVMNKEDAKYYNSLEKVSDCVTIEPIDCDWIPYREEYNEIIDYAD